MIVKFTISKKLSAKQYNDKILSIHLLYYLLFNICYILNLLFSVSIFFNISPINCPEF